MTEPDEASRWRYVDGAYRWDCKCPGSPVLKAEECERCSACGASRPDVPKAWALLRCLSEGPVTSAHEIRLDPLTVIVTRVPRWTDGDRRLLTAISAAFAELLHRLQAIREHAARTAPGVTAIGADPLAGTPMTDRELDALVILYGPEGPPALPSAVATRLAATLRARHPQPHPPAGDAALSA